MSIRTRMRRGRSAASRSSRSAAAACRMSCACRPFTASTRRWSGTRCVPTVDVPDAHGEACATTDADGVPIDSCAQHSICRDGACARSCGERDPLCPDGQLCVGFVGGFVPLCVNDCEPLLGDCAPDEVCVYTPTISGPGFVCMEDASGEDGAAGDPCEDVNSCDPGMFCGSSVLVAGCRGAMCCTPYCDPEAPESCSLPQQECLAWLDMPEFGVCGVP